MASALKSHVEALLEAPAKNTAGAHRMRLAATACDTATDHEAALLPLLPPPVAVPPSSSLASSWSPSAEKTAQARNWRAKRSAGHAPLLLPATAGRKSGGQRWRRNPATARATAGPDASAERH
jgi:murein DD-endopeptidase MepM/ murein hydrolase activator NlpD